MNETRFSRKTVCEVTGISPKNIGYYCKKTGIRTNRTGFTAEQVRTIVNYISRKCIGTADQLRAALDIN